MRAANVAQDHYSDRQAFVDGTADVAAQLWAGVDPDNIVESWTAQIPELSAVLAGAQTGVARAADPYVEESLDAQDLDVADAGYQVVPEAFAGSTVDGGSLAKLLFQPAVQTLLTIGAGASPHDALRTGGYSLDSISRSLVADSGRAADQASLTAHPAADGYTRQLTPPSCSRCAVLAGRFYRWNTGFQRHPRCDCVHVPCHRANPLLTNPFHYYESLSARQRQAAGWNLADQRAIAEGADIFQVTNAHRGLSVAGGRKITTEGTTRRGFAGSRLKGRRPRLTPDQIYRDAGDDREAALQALFDNGYLLQKVKAPVVRERLELAAAERAPAGQAAASAVRKAIGIRAELAKARSVRGVSKAFMDEFERLTGRRPIPASMTGSLHTAREHAEGLLRGLEGFPDADLGMVDVGRMAKESTYAHTRLDTGDVRFSAHWSSAEQRDAYLQSTRHDADTHWHPHGVDSPTAMAMHEFGHVIDLATLDRSAHREIARVVLRASQRAGLPADEFIAREVSRYATKSTEELVAEAFTDVMVNGPAASELSRDIFDVLRVEYERTGRRFVATAPAAAAPAPPPLAKMTVAQLKGLAKERGLVLPAKALKADIVRLLEAPTEPLTGRELRAAARARNLEITRRDQLESVLAQLDEDLAKGANATVLRQALQGLPDLDPRDVASLERALDDRTKLRAAMGRVGKKYGIAPTARAGQVVPFDEALHIPVADITIAPGTKVTVVRRGVTVTLPDGTVLTPTRALVKTTAAKTRAAAAPRGATQYEARQAALRELIKQTATETRQLGGGYSAYTSLLRYANGDRLVEKVYSRLNEALAEARRAVDAERFGAQILDAVGVRAPAVEQLSPGRLAMEWIDGPTGQELADGRWSIPGAGPISPEILASDDAHLMGLADLLMANTDRNEGNWLQMHNGRLAGIDHGATFEHVRPTPGRAGFNPFSSPFVQKRASGGRRDWADTIDMSPADLVLIRARLEALRPAFVQAKRTPWYNQVMARLKEIEKRATGTRNRIAP